MLHYYPYLDKTKLKGALKIIDKIIVGILVVILFGFLCNEYAFFGIKLELIHLPPTFHEFFEILPYAFFFVLVIDLYLKYRLIGSFKPFFRKHWFDFITAILIPVLLPLKFFNVKIYKFAKFSKSIIKLFKKLNII